MAVFATGSTIVRRDVFEGRVWSACPARILSDDGGDLVFGYWPGVVGVAPLSWIDWLTTGDAGRRSDGLADLAGRRWELGCWRWQWTNVVHALAPGRWFSVDSFFDAATGEQLCWYVNFERPYVRTAMGVDTFDLLVDIVVRPDLTWSWKDEGEYEHACRLGLIPETDQAAVRAARDEAIGLIEGRTGPFASQERTWRPDPGWPTPELPPGADLT